MANPFRRLTRANVTCCDDKSFLLDNLNPPLPPPSDGSQRNRMAVVKKKKKYRRDARNDFMTGIIGVEVEF